MSAEIQNNGGTDLSNIPWSIELDGLVMYQQNSEGTIDLLPAGGSIQINTGLLFGLGQADATIRVDTTEKECQVLVLGPLVIKR